MHFNWRRILFEPPDTLVLQPGRNDFFFWKMVARSADACSQCGESVSFHFAVTDSSLETQVSPFGGPFGCGIGNVASKIDGCTEIEAVVIN